jgi:putative ABC transport system ATP-binding protein
MSLIDVRDIVKIYRTGDVELRALDGVTFTVDRGEFVSIMGHSGSGKSTMMNILGCLDVPDEGSYSLDGSEVGSLPKDALAGIRNRKIGFVFQGFNLLPRATALENVELPLIYAGVRENQKGSWEGRPRAGGSRGKDDTPSKPDVRRPAAAVAIARALVGEPPLILADEPTGNLYTKTSEEIMNLFVELNREGKTIILVTHEPDIAEYSSRTLMFRDGKLTGDERRAPRA